MKVCIAYVKDYKKPDRFKIRDGLVSTLIDLGLPKEVAQLMNEQESVTWRNYEIDGDVVFVAQILRD